MSRFLRTAVISRLAYAVEQSERFEAFHAANADLELKAFILLFTQDDVLARVWENLRQHLDLSPSEWHDRAEGTTIAPLPTSPPAAMAFRFAVFRLAQRKKIDLRYFVSNHFKGEHLNARLMEWKLVFVHPFAADLRLLSDRIGRHLPDEEWVDLDGALAACLNDDVTRDGFGPRYWTPADDAAYEAAEAAKKEGKARPPAASPAAVAPPASPTPKGLSANLGKLRTDLASATFSSEARHDLTLDLDALKLELERTTFASDRFIARLETLKAHEPLAASATALLEAVS